jgi:hypothetical protein
VRAQPGFGKLGEKGDSFPLRDMMKVYETFGSAAKEHALKRPV